MNEEEYHHWWRKEMGSREESRHWLAKVEIWRQSRWE